MSDSHLPIIIDARRRRFFVIGGGAVAKRKVKTLIAAKAQVTVIAPHIDEAILSLAGEQLVCFERVAGDEAYQAGDYVILATDDARTNEHQARLARKAGA
ncbi:MAG: NAD(P)-dependent oxidoreductase, partial [Thalassolituus sp.]|nr:NAD(P)-dependent oxidoreductase [Thalassolituus sp.]